MPGVRIRVESGPDEGLEVALGKADVRIGRGAAAKVILTDQGIMGTLRVWFDAGVYKVSNEIDTTVGRPAELRLSPAEGDDEWPFPPRTETVWYANHKIRLTDDTRLVLVTDPDLNLPDGQHVVSRTQTSAAQKKEKDIINVVLALVLFGVAGMLFTMDPEQGEETKSEQEVSQHYRRVALQLKDAEKDQSVGRSASAVRMLLQDARLAEVSFRKAEAADRYVAARDELNRLLGAPEGQPGTLVATPEATAPFREARAFVGERMIELKEHLVRDRSSR